MRFSLEFPKRREKRKRKKKTTGRKQREQVGGEGGDEGAAFWDYQHRDKRGETQETNGAAKNL